MDPALRGRDSVDQDHPAPWRRDEHNRFMQALEAYGGDACGDEWKKITAYVQTRTIEEVQLHGRQYLRELMQRHHQQHGPSSRGSGGISGASPSPSPSPAHPTPLLTVQGIDPMQFPLSASRELQALASQNNQNDPNGQNQQQRSRGGNTKVDPLLAANSLEPAKARATVSALSAAARSAAAAMNLASAQGAGVGNDKQSSRRPNGWSFADDKALELALASWTRGKPYSWAKIASGIPGKTAKEARARYDQLIEDLSSIENAPSAPIPSMVVPGSLRLHGIAAISSADASNSRPPKPPPHQRRSSGSSGLSTRISPPPPIEVPPLTSKLKPGMTDSPSHFFPGSARSSRSTGAIGMLSPTFLDFFNADDRTMTDLPSPLLPSPPMAASSSLASETATGESEISRSSDRRRRTGTPRIWHEVSSDETNCEGKCPQTRQATTSSSDAESHRKSPHSRRSGKGHGRSPSQST